MDRFKFYVAIVGGGPGGSATALSLLSYAPSLTVALIEASRYDAPRIGETLPPPAREILEHLDVWEAFRAQGHREVYGTSAVWGSTATVENEFIYMPAGTGWHLDRAAFDEMLAGQAEKRGAALMSATRLLQAERINHSWRLSLSSGHILFARFIVDATGGAAVFARWRGAHFVASDRLVGIARFFEADGDDPRTMVEAFEDGWWYTAGLPNWRRMTACMTDADLARRLNLTGTAQWSRLLATMPNI